MSNTKFVTANKSLDVHLEHKKLFPSFKIMANKLHCNKVQNTKLKTKYKKYSIQCNFVRTVFFNYYYKS